MSFKGKREGNKGKAKIGNGKITKGGNKGKGKKIQTKGIKKNNTQTSSSVNINVDNVAKRYIIISYLSINYLVMPKHPKDVAFLILENQKS